MFTEIYLRGYKSFRDEQRLPIGRLTILAGANSSGKSSAIQPLLLFKQTLLSNSDPGALRLDGPNVVFSRSEQMFWRAPGEESEEFEIGVKLQSSDSNMLSVRSTFQRRKEPRGLPSLEIKRTIWETKKYEVKVSRETSEEEIIRFLEYLPGYLKEITGQFLDEKTTTTKDFQFLVERQRCFLEIIGRFQKKVEIFRFPVEAAFLEKSLRSVIHVPGLRGNPERSYPVRAVGQEFPGQFQDYVASLIARWQRRRSAQWRMLNDALGRMKLTWKVRAYQRSDTEVELQVGRTVRGRRGGAKDLVNIADVGFGLSQSLPVLVALIAAEPGQTVYLEQPEIHLHPEAQVALADVISEAVKRDVQVIVETHSHLLLMAFQRSIAKGVLTPEYAILHWFERDDEGVTKVSSTSFTKGGSYTKSDIPIDFADVSLKLMREYLEASDKH